MDPRLKWETNGRGPANSIVVEGCYRFSILTSSLIRMEYSRQGHFEDAPTQVVFCRDFPAVRKQESRNASCLEIKTDLVKLLCDPERQPEDGVMVHTDFGVWHFGENPENLGGTARTLDGADGECCLERGILSKAGFAMLDDSASLLLREDGLIEPRKEEEIDVYLFAYGHRYREALRDFYRLTGKTPLLPRFALGNWWSRYHKYTQSSYQALIQRFEEEAIPFSVAVIDMDWHLVDVDERYGTGWTGYTWNREFFPDPPAFLSWLHSHGLKATLNVHPADGVRAYEEPYTAMAEAMGLDPASEEAIPFAIHDEKFLHAYLECLHHPLEEEGVDFWWIDWQQGNKTAIHGLDPLWMLNHYHYLDSKRRGNRPLTFSRYAGPGSHRYPVGFSGDTVISWKSLDFQPYFTATASNIGYGWWSHDIGGHMGGTRDDELTIRWVQFGVFSPIFRLHSTDNKYNGKEPWNYNREAESIIKEFLLLRHRLIPYLYTMNIRASEESLPLIQPMYYGEPKCQEAYQVPNEYYFGDSAIVCPITRPVDQKSRTAGFDAWLPQGIWHDFFLPLVYHGGKKKHLERCRETIPVLVKAGGILPLANLSEFTNLVANPEVLDLHVFGGNDGSFCLQEDACETAEEKLDSRAYTDMELSWVEGNVTIHPVRGNRAAVPEKRQFQVYLRGFSPREVSVYKNGNPAQAEIRYETALHALAVKAACGPEDELKIRWNTPSQLLPNEVGELIEPILNRAQVLFEDKQEADRLLCDRFLSMAEKYEKLKDVVKEEALRDALFEILDEVEI